MACTRYLTNPRKTLGFEDTYLGAFGQTIIYARLTASAVAKTNALFLGALAIRLGGLHQYTAHGRYLDGKEDARFPESELVSLNQ